MTRINKSCQSGGRARESASILSVKILSPKQSRKFDYKNPLDITKWDKVNDYRCSKKTDD